MPEPTEDRIIMADPDPVDFQMATPVILVADRWVVPADPWATKVD